MTADDDTTPREPVAGEQPVAAAPEPPAADPAGEPAAAQAASGPGADLQAAEQQRDEYLDALQRLKAEFENFRKRNERDRAAQREAIVRDVVLEVVPVLDNLERAVAALGAADASLVEGVDMVRQQLAEVLGARGLREIEVAGEAFDPVRHDAVSVVPADEPEGTIVAVAQKGYRMDDAVIRAAKVVVSAGPSPAGT